MSCDRQCIHRDGSWCDSCWAEILKGGWHQMNESDTEEEKGEG